MTWLDELLSQYPALSVAKERLAQVEARLRHLEAENKKLKDEKAERERGPDLEAATRFLEYKGVLWAQADGTIGPVAYCPRCKLAMSALPPGSDEMLVCSKCNFTAPFLPSQVDAVAKQLEGELLSA